MKDLNQLKTQILALLVECPVYRKRKGILFQVRSLLAGEMVETILADGRIETVNVAKEGDFEITNPGGEKHIVAGEKFPNLYEEVEGMPGVYRAKGKVRAFPNPFGEEVVVTASWGTRNGAADCLLAVGIEPSGSIGSSLRIIGGDEFHLNYEMDKD